MKVRITPFTPKGVITAPPSKSVAMRDILLAAVADGKTVIENVGDSADVLAAIDCAGSLGAEVDYDGRRVIVYGIKTLPETADFDFGECGFLLRTVIPVANALGVKFSYRTRGNLSLRPVKPLFDALSKSLFKTENGEYYGKATAGKFVIDGSQSSQFISGLLFALPLLDGDSEIVLDGEQVSKSYVDITIDVLKLYGIEITPSKSGYFIKGNQTYKSGKTVKVEGDWSGAAFYLSAGAINGEITVKGLNPESVQGDRKIIGVLKRFGASVTVSEGGVTVKRNELNGTTVDLEDIPDLGQIISVVAAYATGETVLKSVNRLKIKESDRLKAITDMLSVSGIAYYSADDELKIYGGAPKGGSFSGGNDHRTVMSCAVLAANAMGETQITDAEAINKSYPDFFKDYKILGGTVNGDI